MRLDRAERLLLETRYSVEKVARVAGFGSTQYFIQFFLKWVGKTPRRNRVDLHVSACMLADFRRFSSYAGE